MIHKLCTYSTLKVKLPFGHRCPRCSDQEVWAVDKVYPDDNKITCTSCDLCMSVDATYLQYMLDVYCGNTMNGLERKFKKIGWKKLSSSTISNPNYQKLIDKIVSKPRLT